MFVPNRWRSVDFSRIEAAGKFYYLEGLRDDMVAQVKPGQHLEFTIETRRVTETIAAVLEFSKRYCGPDSENNLSVVFRWKGLEGRILSTWASPDRRLSGAGTAHQDKIVAETEIPVSTPINAIGLHVEKVLKPVFRLFDGKEFESSVIQDIVEETLGRRM